MNNEYLTIGRTEFMIDTDEDLMIEIDDDYAVRTYLNQDEIKQLIDFLQRGLK